MDRAMDHEITRRTFVRGTLVGGASLLVPLFVTACARDRGAPGSRAAEYTITDWIAILPSGEVVLGVSQPEVGQGSYTALPQILADELDADWSRVSVRFVTGKEAYTIAFHAAGLHDEGSPPRQIEGASMSTTKLYDRLRVAGAQAREALVRGACLRWNVAPSDCTTDGEGFVVNRRSGDRLSYGALAATTATLPLNPDPPLKRASELRLIGRPLHRLDSAAKCDGSAIFGIDVTVPGMLNAAIKIAPTFTGTVVRVRNERDIAKMPGVHRIVTLPNAVAVVADKFWQAKRAADALDILFDPGSDVDLSSDKIDGLVRAAMTADVGVTVLDQGNARHPRPAAKRRARASTRCRSRPT
jgi:isoquinoline 1-oxidoreductase beta subunit